MSRGVTSRMTAATIMTIALASKVVITPRSGHLPGIVDPGATQAVMHSTLRGRRRW